MMDSSSYFMCDTEGFKFLADMIQHVPLPLRARYVFCCAPINRKQPFVCTMFLKVSFIKSTKRCLQFECILNRNYFNKKCGCHFKNSAINV